MDRQPLISIILPAYNAEKYIQQAIDSVLTQTYRHWELVIINDGSVDGTEKIILRNRHVRIQYFKKSNGGVSSARNLGLQKMTGDYFCFLDADDVLPPRSLEARVNKFLEDDRLEYVDGVVVVFDAALRRKIRTFVPKFSGYPLPRLLTLSDSCFFGLSWMIKRKSNVYEMKEELSHGEDLLFYLTLSRSGGRYDFVDEEILYYRRHEQSAMQNLEGLHEGYKRIYALLRDWPEFLFAHRMIYKYKTKKFIFLSYVSSKKYKNALVALFS